MAKIKLNKRGERVDDDGNRLDGDGNKLEDDGEEMRNLEDELKPDEHFSNKSPIVLPPAGRKHYELKNSTISFVRDMQYNGLKSEDPMDHIEAFENYVENSNAEGVSLDWLSCKLFPHSLSHKALSWFKGLKPGSLKNWGEVKSEFINEFFDEVKSDEIRKQISTFSQERRETFKEAWMRYSEYLKKCPHHGFSKIQVVKTFFRGLQWEHKKTLDTISGGNFGKQRHDEALNVIEEYARSSSANQLNDHAATIGADEAEELRQQNAELKKMMEQILRGHAPDGKAKPKANVNYVEEVPPPHDSMDVMLQQILDGQQRNSWEISSKMDSMYGDLNAQIEAINTRMRLTETQMTQVTDAVKQKGIIQGKAILNSREHVNAVSTMKYPQEKREACVYDRLELEEEEEKAQTDDESADYSTESTDCSKVDRRSQTVDRLEPPETGNRESSQPKPPERVYKPTPPYPARVSDDERCEAAIEVWKKELPSLNNDVLTPTLRKYAKEIMKESIMDNTVIQQMIEECYYLLQKDMPKKMGDPGCFALDCTIDETRFEHSLCDAGSSVNIISHAAAKELGHTDLKPSKLALRYADGSVGNPEGVLEDIPVMVGNRFIPVDFHVLKMEDEPDNPLLLGRPFLATAGVLMDMRNRKMDLRLGDEVLSFEMAKSEKRSTVNGQAFQVETISAAKIKSAKVFDPGEEKKVIAQPELSMIPKEPATATKQKAPNKTLPSSPPRRRTCDPSTATFLGKPPAPNAYKPPWTRRIKPTYAVYSNGPRPP